MTFVYPVIITKKHDDDFEGIFPDLEMCTCSGKTLFDALEDARHAMFHWIDLELQEENPVMPHVSDIDEISLKENQSVHNVMVHYRFTEGWDE